MFPSAGRAAIQTASSHLAGKEWSISPYSTCSCTIEFKRFKIKFQLVGIFFAPEHLQVEDVEAKGIGAPVISLGYVGIDMSQGV